MASRRKIKRAGKSNSPVPIAPAVLNKSLPVVKKRFIRQRCAFVDTDTGKECSRYAVGKSTLCKSHGGCAVIPENLLSDKEVRNSLITKFDVEFHPKEFLYLSSTGKHIKEIAAIFEVSEITLKNWAETYESFYEVVEIAKTMQEAYFITEGKDNLKNRNYNNKMFGLLADKLVGWGESSSSTHSAQVTIGVLQVAPAVSQEEWTASFKDAPIDVTPTSDE